MRCTGIRWALRGVGALALALGIIGIFFPILWLIGAVLPAKEGSAQWVAQGIAHQQRMDQYTR